MNVCSLGNDPFYASNVDSFKESIDITHRATGGGGFIAVKPTALCSPNLWVCLLHTVIRPLNDVILCYFVWILPQLFTRAQPSSRC